MDNNESFDQNKGLSVVKSNRIIEAKYRLNVREQKFILYMVSLIKPDDQDFKFYRVKISEFEKILNSDSKKWGNIYQTVKDIILNLNDKPLIIAKDGGRKQQIINWIASAEFEIGTGIIEFEFSDKLKPYLLQLKSHFTKYSLDNILQLKSGFSIRIYELLKSHQYQGKVEYNLEELKTLLGVDNKYDEYTDFKKRVLKTAQIELRNKSDIYFDFKEKRLNRKINSLLFTIFENSELKEQQIKTPPQKTKETPQSLSDVAPNTSNEAVGLDTFIIKLVNIGFTKAKAKEIAALGFENIKEMETRVKAQAQFLDAQNWFEERLQFFETEMKKGTITHVQGFFVKLLQDNYINPEIEKQQKIELIKQKNKERAQQKDNLEAELKAIGDAVWSKKMSIATNLLKQNEALLDEITAGNGTLLFKGNFDKTLSFSDNFLKAPMPICVWVISKIEEHTPLYFEHLATDKKKMAALRDMIAKT
jgi:plasmid replication initiation protein